MNAKAVQFIALGVLAVAGAYWLKQRRETSNEANADSVTTTDRGGTTTTPIKTHAVAVIAEPFRAITSLARAVLAFPASVIQGGTPDRLQPYGNKTTAAAAYNAPLRPDYVPAIRAADNIVYTK